MESRVELFALIRRDALVEGLSVSGLAADPFKAMMDAMLIEDTAAPRKQRHTAPA